MAEHTAGFRRLGQAARRYRTKLVSDGRSPEAADRAIRIITAYDKDTTPRGGLKGSGASAVNGLQSLSDDRRDERVSWGSGTGVIGPSRQDASTIRPRPQSGLTLHWARQPVVDWAQVLTVEWRAASPQS